VPFIEMTDHVLYSVLGYRHNHLADEKVNVAVLVILPLSGRLYFLFPSKGEVKHRLQHLYSDFPLDTLWRYLQSFHARSKKLSGKLGSYLEDYSTLINDHFLIENGSALFFGGLNTAPVWKDVPGTLAALQFRFLSDYDKHQPEERLELHNEAYISRKVKDLIKDAFLKKGRDNYQLYLKEEKRTVTNGFAHISGEEYWQNGSTNLIHPLSLDLKTSESIVNKSLVLAKSAELVREKAAEQNIRFHILLSKPQDSNLQSYYRDAVQILESATNDRLRIIEPNELHDYSLEVAESARSVS